VNTKILRPSGTLRDVLRGFESASWRLIGCVSTEDRALRVPADLLKSEFKFVEAVLLDIQDEPDSPFGAQAEVARRRMRAAVAGDSRVRYVRSRLLAAPAEVVRCVKDACEGAEAVVLDLSCMPKRFFFPMIRSLLDAGSSVRHLVFAYASPRAYPSPGRLSIDPCLFQPLPTFGPSDSASWPSRIIVSVGFQSLGLWPVLSSRELVNVVCDAWVPFPTPLENVRDMRRFVAELQDGAFGSSLRTHGMSPTGFAAAMRFLDSIAREAVWLLPFGPKPLSAAMAIAAVRRDWPVFYTQPRYYRSDYSLGCSTDDGLQCWAHPIRASGFDFY